MIHLQNVTFYRGNRLILQNANLQIYAGQKVGIIGINGCGKSSFLQLLLGNLDPTEGEVAIPAKSSIGYLAQETPGLDIACLDYVLSGDEEYWQIQTALQKATEGVQVASLYDRLNAIDGYQAKTRACVILDGLGFKPDDLTQPIKNFSGGWRVRLNLAKVLFSRAEFLLLDEPTNHLDLDAIVWLESWLKKYSGTVVCISHDRDFLDNTIDKIIHIDQQQLRFYAGNYSQFVIQRAEQMAVQQAAYNKQQQQRAHLQSYIDRFRAKASKAKQAQSRIKALEKMQIIEAVREKSTFEFEFRNANKQPNPLMQLKQVEVGYNDKLILKNINFTITPGTRIGLLGLNGAGKSTLMKLLAGELPVIKGSRALHKDTIIGYFNQQQIDVLELEASPLWHLQKKAPQATEQELRTYLGSFGFPGEMALTTVKNFSGGEKTRLALALLIWHAPNLLLLDEPTNHLDMEMREALAYALQDYQGALILVSHDRYLLRSSVDEFYLVSQQSLQAFNGDLTDYAQWLDEVKKSKVQTKAADNLENQSGVIERQQQKHLRALQLQLRQIEQQISQLNQNKDKLEQLLADAELYTEKQQAVLNKYQQEHQQLQQKILQAEERWLALLSELEK